MAVVFLIFIYILILFFKKKPENHARYNVKFYIFVKMNKYKKYDTFGVLSVVLWNNIKKGDLIIYIDSKRINGEVKKILLEGIWDGKKVCFNNNEKTIVRTTRWLNSVIDKDGSICYIIDKTSNSVNVWMNIKSEKGISCTN